MEELLKEIIHKIDELSQNLNEMQVQREVYRDYLKTEDACEYLSCSKNTLAKICRKNKIYPQKIEGLNYFSVADLRSLFNN